MCHIESETAAEVQVCAICGNPVNPGDGIYTITGNHYDCEFPKGRASFAEIAKDMDDALSAFGFKPKRHKGKEGTGRVALKAKAMAVEAIQRELGTEIFDVVMWNQQGAYRGARWDLDRWGLDFRFMLDPQHPMSGSASCLARMSDFIKGRATARATDIAYTFDLIDVQETADGC